MSKTPRLCVRANVRTGKKPGEWLPLYLLVVLILLFLALPLYILAGDLPDELAAASVAAGVAAWWIIKKGKK